MKIVFFTYLMLEYGGGVAKYYLDVSSGLKKRHKDLEIDILTFDEKTLNKILLLYSVYFAGKQDRHLLNKETTKGIKNKLDEIDYYKVSLSSLKKRLQKYDSIYTTNNLLEVLILKYLIGYRSLPSVIYGFHIPSHYAITNSLQSKLHNLLYASFVYQNALNGASKLHVLNSFDEKMYKKRFSTDKVIKIYNPFNFKGFVRKASEFEFKFNWEGEKFNVLWVGRLTEQKGVDDLAKLVNLINSSKYQNRIIWNIVGEGELKEEVERLVRKWDNVNYHGYIKNNYIPSIYNKSDLFITTSKWESFPFNLLEAQAFGLPAVSYDIHGCRDIIGNGKTGYLVKNINQFKDKIIFTLEEREMKKNFIKIYAESKFDVEKIYQKIYSLLTNN